MSDDFWTPDRIQQLRDLWDDKTLSSSAIGLLMGVGKGSVISKSKRLNLERRPYTKPLDDAARRQIIDLRDDGNKYQKIKEITGISVTTIGDVCRDRNYIPKQRVHNLPPLPPAKPLVIAKKPVFTAPPPKPAQAVVSLFPREQCCWPIGHPKEKGFHFCGARSKVGRPYCDAHAKLAYTRERRDDAA